MPYRLFALLLLIGSPAFAQAGKDKQSPQVSQLANCRAIVDQAQRLACFDRASAEFVDAVARGEISIVNRGEVAEARRSLFGFNLPNIPFLGKGDNDDPPRELTSTLVSIRMYAPERYRFVIKEGNAVWETTETLYLGKAKPGSKVTIRRGPMGGHAVQVENSQWARARRIR